MLFIALTTARLDNYLFYCNSVHIFCIFLHVNCNSIAEADDLRIEDTFGLKTTENRMSLQFLYYRFITSLDRPNKVYIFLKLRATCIHFKREQ